MGENVSGSGGEKENETHWGKRGIESEERDVRRETRICDL